MAKTLAQVPDSLEKDNFEKFAAGLRTVAWLWILGVTFVFALQLDLAGIVVAGLSSAVAFELLGAAALAVGPGSLGLALAFVIERVSYLAADLNLF